jgi:hypothetical protein
MRTESLITQWQLRRWVAASAATVLLTCSAICSAAEPGAKRFPVTQQMVLKAMKSRRMPVDGLQVALSAEITASVPNPDLEVQSVSVTGTRRAMLRLACKSSAECIPFYISAAWPEGSDPVSLPSPAPAQQTRTLTQGSQAPVALRAGTPATLTIDDDRLHIQLRVITLQSGSEGERIRVATPDRRKAFVAEVLSSSLLKGSF